MEKWLKVLEEGINNDVREPVNENERENEECGCGDYRCTTCFPEDSKVDEDYRMAPPSPDERQRYPNREKEGLKGPFRMRNGQWLYFDEKEGTYYNPDVDVFVDIDDVNPHAMNSYRSGMPGVNMHENEMEEILLGDDDEFADDLDELDEIDYTPTSDNGLRSYRNREEEGLEGPFRTRTGQWVYYDKMEGKYYDPDTDLFFSDEDATTMFETNGIVSKKTKESNNMKMKHIGENRMQEARAKKGSSIDPEAVNALASLDVETAKEKAEEILANSTTTDAKKSHLIYNLQNTRSTAQVVALLYNAILAGEGLRVADSKWHTNEDADETVDNDYSEEIQEESEDVSELIAQIRDIQDSGLSMSDKHYDVEKLMLQKPEMIKRIHAKVLGSDQVDEAYYGREELNWHDYFDNDREAGVEDEYDDEMSDDELASLRYDDTGNLDPTDYDDVYGRDDIEFVRDPDAVSGDIDFDDLEEPEDYGSSLPGEWVPGKNDRAGHSDSRVVDQRYRKEKAARQGGQYSRPEMESVEEDEVSELDFENDIMGADASEDVSELIAEIAYLQDMGLSASDKTYDTDKLMTAKPEMIKRIHAKVAGVDESASCGGVSAGAGAVNVNESKADKDVVLILKRLLG